MLTENNILHAYAYCKEDISLIENYDIAINDNKRYVCHHKNGLLKSRTELIEQKLYFNRPADELIFMEIAEHNSLHNKSKILSEETKHKMSNANTGEKNPMYGVHRYADKNPMAKQCTINGITYGCLKDAYEIIKPKYSYVYFCRQYKKGEL